jgi:hypothetical protein
VRSFNLPNGGKCLKPLLDCAQGARDHRDDVGVAPWWLRFFIHYHIDFVPRTLHFTVFASRRTLTLATL